MATIDLGMILTGVNNASPAIKSASSDVKGLGENAQATANRLKAIQVVIAGILLEKTIEFGQKAITAAAATQALDLRMAAFAGSVQKAQAVWSDLNQSLGASGLSIDNASAAWIKLRSAVSTNAQTSDIIKSIGNDVAAIGGNDSNVTNLAEAFQRMFATGIVSAREYKGILQQTGLTIGDLAKAAGTTANAFSQQLSQGFVKAQDFADDFVKASNERFGFFASNLKASVGGAYNYIFSTISKGISDIGAKTDLNARITATFNNIATAIDGVMESISQQDIDNFFKWLSSLEPVAIAAAKAIVNIGSAVLGLVGVVANLLSSVPSDAIEYGMVGYFLFGKKGAAVLGVLGAIKSALPSAQTINHLATTDIFGNKIADPRDALAQAHGSKDWAHSGGAASPLDSLLNAFNIKGTGAASGGLHILPTQQDIDKAKAALDNLLKGFNTAGAGAGGVISSQMNEALKAALALTQSLADTLTKTGDQLQALDFSTKGDELGAAMQQIRLQGDGFSKSIDDAIKSEAALKIHTAANLALVAALRAEKARIPGLIDAAIQKEQQLYAIGQKEFVLAQDLAQMQNAFKAQQLNQSQGGWMQQIFLGTDGGKAILNFQQQQETYLESINQLNSQLLDISKQERDVAADPIKVKALEDTKTSLQGVLAATQNALDNLSVTGQVLNQMWQELGSTLQNDIASGISGLIQGTESLGDAARKVFADMIDLAVKYLVQLLFIKAASSFGGLPFANGGILPGGVQPFANGGVPGVTKFGDGGITTGPTMFGLMGEAGTEAIMPLTRVNGKLGVRTSGGGGGDHYHIHLSAIDTQTGLEFVGKHIDTIDAQLQHKKRLNRGSK